MSEFGVVEVNWSQDWSSPVRFVSIRLRQFRRTYCKRYAQGTFNTPKTSLSPDSTALLDPGLDRLPLRGLMTTSPQCLGTAPRFKDVESAGASGSIVVTMIEGSWAFDEEEETELWRVACGWRWGCG
jgi:hypothetical protein